MSTVYDVFRRLPVARSVQPMARANEREEAKALLPHVPAGGILLFDRGYPSYGLIGHLRRHYQGWWLFRCPARSTFPAVEAFVRSGRAEAMITLHFGKSQSLALRAIRLSSPDGTLSVLLTNLEGDARFTAEAVTALYFLRWGVEIHH